MSFADFVARMKQFDKNAEIIFDREEPIGTTTDLVMPRHRWFRARSNSIGRVIPIRHLRP